MAQDAEYDTTAQTPGRRRSFWWRWAALPLLLILAAVALAVWFQRHTIAANVIDNYLRSHHVRATYKIDHIGGTRQVLSNIVVGDPNHPDLTVERAEVAIRYRLGFPAIAGVVLVRPRLYGTYLHGKLSFGALDPLIFQPKQPRQPFELPDYSLDLIDGRALLETDYGPVGVKAEGKGYLRGRLRRQAGGDRAAIDLRQLQPGRERHFMATSASTPSGRHSPVPCDCGRSTAATARRRSARRRSKSA